MKQQNKTHRVPLLPLLPLVASLPFPLVPALVPELVLPLDLLRSLDLVSLLLPPPPSPPLLLEPAPLADKGRRGRGGGGAYRHESVFRHDSGGAEGGGIVKHPRRYVGFIRSSAPNFARRRTADSAWPPPKLNSNAIPTLRSPHRFWTASLALALFFSQVSTISALLASH